MTESLILNSREVWKPSFKLIELVPMYIYTASAKKIGKTFTSEDNKLVILGESLNGQFKFTKNG